MPHGTGQHHASWHRATLCLMAQGNTMPHGTGQHHASWHRAPCLMAQGTMPHGTGQHHASWHRATLCLMAQGNTMPHGTGQHYASWHRATPCLMAQSNTMLMAQGNTMPHVTGQHYASWHRTLCFMAQGKQANVNNTWLPFFAPSKGQIKVSASTSDLLRLWPNKPNFPLCNTCTHHLAIQSQSLKFHGNTFFSSIFFFFLLLFSGRYLAAILPVQFRN